MRMSMLLTRTPAIIACFLSPAWRASPAMAMKASLTTINYAAFFKTPWREDRQEGLLHLEHVNICVPAHGPAKRLYYQLLGFMPDKRRAQNIDKGSGTIWANVGTTQLHLPEGEPQVVPGVIGVIYSDLEEVVSRLQTANAGDDTTLEGTKFSWKNESGDVVDVTCPHGNTLRLHSEEADSSTMPRATAQTSNHNQGRSGDAVSPRSLDPRGGRLPSIPFPSTPSPPRGGLGIAYVHFRVRPGTGAGISRFYREVFAADAEDFNATGDTCLSDSRSETDGETEEATVRGAVVRVGPVQHLAFVEDEEELPEYDGHHICVYLSEEGFRQSFKEADKKGLVFVNSRPNFGKADTLERALEEKQFRVKNIVDSSTGELLHVLEHEVRSVSHPSYPVGRDV